MVEHVVVMEFEACAEELASAANPTPAVVDSWAPHIIKVFERDEAMPPNCEITAAAGPAVGQLQLAVMPTTPRTGSMAAENNNLTVVSAASESRIARLSGCFKITTG